MGGKQHTANSISEATGIQVASTQQMATVEPWLNEVIEKGKLIIRELARESFTRYRQLGLLILNSGYEKGQWHNEEKWRVIRDWNISQQTFNNLIRLAQLTQDEFTDIISKFNSIYDWTHQQLGTRIDIMDPKRRLVPYDSNMFYVSEKFQTSRPDSWYVIKEGEPFPTLKRRSWFFHEDGKEFSLREYAEVQEFPGDFVFVGSKEDIKNQIGNAQPPPMAYFVAKQIEPSNAVALFSGAGGMSLGFKRAGHSILWANDIDRMCHYTYSANFPDVKFHQGDIQKIDVSTINSELEGKQCSLVFGAAPCQGFSMSGHRFKDDPRNSLYKEFLRVVVGLGAKCFVMENVEGIKPFMPQIVEDMQSEGFDVETRLVRGEDVGMRQRRHRWFFIGRKRGGDASA